MSDQAMGRDELSAQLDNLTSESVEVRVKSRAWILKHAAALREELTQVKEERDSWHKDASSHLMALCEKQAEVNTLEARLAELEGQLEAHAWTISPAMAQAKIDELQAKITELEGQP